MSGFDDYGGFLPMERDPELESALKKCKTEEEREKVMKEYFLMKAKLGVIGLIIFILVIALASFVAVLCK